MKKAKVNTKKRILLTGASGTVGFETLNTLSKIPIMKSLFLISKLQNLYGC